MEYETPVNTTFEFIKLFVPSDSEIVISIVIDGSANTGIVWFRHYYMIPTSCPRRTPCAFTLLEVLAVITVIMILVALLVPLAKSAIMRAQAAKCLSNLKQISVASAAYSSDFNAAWPPGRNQVVFADFLIPYLGHVPGRTEGNFLDSPLICPSARTSKPDSSYFYKGIYTPSSYVDSDTGKTITYGLSYGQNINANEKETVAADRVSNRAVVEHPSSMMLYMDYVSHYRAGTDIFSDSQRMAQLKERHRGVINVAFADGSVRGIPWGDIPITTRPINWFWQGRGNQ